MPDSKKLKRIMDEQDMSQAELGRRAGIKPANVSHIVNSNRDVRESTLMKIARALGCKAEDIALDCEVPDGR